MLPTPETSGAAPLRGGHSQRQSNMIALGGVIGAGLFVGPGAIIGETGPGAFITYAVDKVRATYPIPVIHVVPGQSALSSA